MKPLKSSGRLLKTENVSVVDQDYGMPMTDPMATGVLYGGRVNNVIPGSEKENARLLCCMRASQQCHAFSDVSFETIAITMAAGWLAA
ncbi:hypothetical protein V6N12_053525 [Hibiscus sabdariffa]|uniref:Uncharacterized protein n=1 Tax=Hibiscus sabdariffa TaxID=183260 RepID=A0ABR2D9H6_9ROSI